MEFFPDYTLHGISHIERVLKIIDRLIPPETLETLKSDSYPNSLEVLCAGTILHDIGMFLTFKGFQELIANDRQLDVFDGEQKRVETWKGRWEKYRKEIAHASEHKLLGIYGKKDPYQMPNFCDLDYGRPETDDRYIIGEFVRRYHNEISQRIIEDGFIRADGERIDLYPHRDSNIKKLVGLMARGHGDDVRSLESQIKVAGMGSRRGFPEGVPFYYLVSLLKLADTLDMGECRAPESGEDNRYLSSPKSQQEWLWNRAIKQETMSWDNPGNPERLHIDVDTDHADCTSIFVKIEKELSKVQAELDMAWAVTGEFYGTRLGFTKRRITSNIDKGERARVNMGKKFLTQEVSLKVNPAVMSLLIEPLYDNNPYACVRELLQNAVDACLEKMYESEKQGLDYSPHIEVVVDPEAGTLTLADNGIGMNAEVVRDYFMEAGAKFRESENWLGHLDEHGNTKVLRSGRFGIGALTGFLVGDEIEVTTRSADESKGLHFTIFENGRCSDVERVDAEEGTKIIVKLTKVPVDVFSEKEKQSRWTSWYLPEAPQIRYFIGKEELVGNPSESWPADEESYKAAGWGGPVDIGGGATAYWRLAENQDGSKLRNLRSSLTGVHCYNGMRLQDGAKRNQRELFFLEDLDLSIYDPNASLLIELSRNSVTLSPEVEQAIDRAVLDSYRRGNLEETLSWIKENPPTPKDGQKKLVVIDDFLWRVLSVEGDKALLITEHIVERRTLDKSGKEYGWASCELKRWLNGTWLEGNLQALSANSRIAAKTESGEDLGRVFVLSKKEVEKYMAGGQDSSAHGIKSSDGRWWLRSPGNDANCAASVRTDGSVYAYGGVVYNDDVGVRPAFWLNL
jgi:hypothetical protein